MMKQKILGCFIFILSSFYGSSQPLVSYNDSLENVIKRLPDQWQPYYFYAQKNYRSQPKKAKKYLRIAKKLAINTDSALAIAAVDQLIGVSFKNTGQSDSAILYYLSALKVYETEESVFGIASTANDLGILFKINENFEEALKYYKKAYWGVLKVDHKVGQIMTLNNIGTIYDQIKSIDSAHFYYKKALALAELINHTNGLALANNNLGEFHAKQGLHDLAIKYFKITLKYDKLSEDKIGQAYTYINLAQSLAEKGNPRHGIIFLDSAISSTEQLEAITPLQEALKVKSNILKEIQQFEESLDVFEKHVSLKDSLFNIQKAEAISELQTKYETEKKEQTIALQTAEIKNQRAALKITRILSVGLVLLVILLIIIGLQQRKYMLNKRDKLLAEEKAKIKESQIEAAINTQEEERKRFARDLHDGFGQMISVLNLNLSNLDSHPEKRQEVYQNSTEVLDQMYKELKSICFNLMPETLIKNGLTDAIGEFALRINNAGKVQIETNFFGMDERLGDVQEISLYRITQEWVNNVIKYSDAGSITIQLTKDEEEINLLIEDDGMGFDKTLLTQGSGNGWKNLNSRANLIKGVLELDTDPNIKGNTLIVDIAKAITTENRSSETIEAA